MKQKINRALTIAAMVLSFFLILALTKFIPSMVLSVFADHDVSQTDAVSPSEPNDPVIPYVNRINVLENPMKPMARGILTHVTSSGASITVAKLFEELGVSQSADDVTGIDCNSRFFDTNTGTGGSRVIQTTRSFDSLETLTFQFSDGSTLPIIFKDSLYVTNIAPLCTDVSIIINGKNYSSNSTESYDEPVAVNGKKTMHNTFPAEWVNYARDYINASQVYRPGIFTHSNWVELNGTKAMDSFNTQPAYIYKHVINNGDNKGMNPIGTVRIGDPENGKETSVIYPVFRFSVAVNGIYSNDPIVIEDCFDTTLFKMFDKRDFGNVSKTFVEETLSDGTHKEAWISWMMPQFGANPEITWNGSGGNSYLGEYGNQSYQGVFYRTDRYTYTYNLQDMEGSVPYGNVHDRFVPVVINLIPHDNSSWVYIEQTAEE